MLTAGIRNFIKWSSIFPRCSKIHTGSAVSSAAYEGQIAVDSDEIQHHAKLANEWWNSDGPLAGLHSMNAVRVPFIREGLIVTNKVNPEFINTSQVLKDLEILEVGCGGGILTENLARLHANVTGIDLGADVIRVAKKHLENESCELLDRIKYKTEPVEAHAQDNLEKYDAVVLSEVLEHVPDKVSVLSACVDALKPGGSIFITAPNKTFSFWVGGIIIGENFLNIVPKGTHSYDKLISPIETQRILDTLNCSTILVNGLIYEFWSNTWRWIPSTMFTYALQAVKIGSTDSLN